MLQVIDQESNTQSRLQVSLRFLSFLAVLLMLMHCSDFGMAKTMTREYYKTDDKTVPVRWCSPEALEFGKFSSQSGKFLFSRVVDERTDCFLFAWLADCFRCLGLWSGVVGNVQLWKGSFYLFPDQIVC